MKKIYIYDISSNKIKHKPEKKILIVFISLILLVILAATSIFFITRNRINTNELQRAFNAYNSIASREISVVSKIFEENNNLFYYNADAVLRKTYFKNTKKDDVFINQENKLQISIHNNNLNFKEKSADFSIKDTVIKQNAYFINRSKSKLPKNDFATVTFSFNGKTDLYNFIDLYYKQLNDLYLQKELYLNSTAIRTSDNGDDIALNLRGQIYAFDEYSQRSYNYSTDFTASASSEDIFKNEKKIFDSIINECIKYSNYTSMLSKIYTDKPIDFTSVKEYIISKGYQVLGFTVTGKTQAIQNFIDKNPGLYIAAAK